MGTRIGFAYNQKAPEDAEPPSGEPPHTRSHDRYAEWDDAATIAAVESALRRAGEVVRLEADAEFPEKLARTRPDIVFNIAEGLNGPNREAHVPAICEFYGIPYTGSDPLALCLALDKRRAKEAFAARGVRTPAYRVIGEVDPSREPEAPLDALPLPAFVKPVYEGSSKGIPEAALCRTVDEVLRRVREIVADHAQPALVEEYLPGREFTCAVLGNGAAVRVLPVVEIRFDALPAGAAPVYGYEAKWVWDTPDEPLEIFTCPADVDPLLRSALEREALSAFHALGCRDWARIDLRLDAAGRPHVLEANPLPGILPDPRQNSCFPKAARAAGIEYDDLICGVLELALERYGLRR